MSGSQNKIDVSGRFTKRARHVTRELVSRKYSNFKQSLPRFLSEFIQFCRKAKVHGLKLHPYYLASMVHELSINVFPISLFGSKKTTRAIKTK